MKTWGLGRWGPLLAVLTLLVSAGALIAPGAQAAGKTVWGTVSDCASPFAEFTGQVSLVEVHRLSSTQQTFDTATQSGYFSFTPQPGYYNVVVNPSGFTHFTNETAPFRFDGTTTIQQPVCVDPMPPSGFNRNRTLTFTVLDAQAAGANDTVTFAQVARGPENVTVVPVEYDPVTANVTLATRPLAWGTEKLTFTDATTGTGGVVLKRGTGPSFDYDYTPQDAFAGKIHISNTTIQNELYNTLHPPAAPRGWLEVTYQNATTSARLSHSQIAWPPSFKKNGNPLVPTYNATLSLNLTTGVLQIIAQDWRFGPDVLTASYFWSGALSGADLTVHYPARNGQPVAQGRTDNFGTVVTSLWDGTYDVEVEKAGYRPTVVRYTVSNSTSHQITLLKGWKVGEQVVVDEDGAPILPERGLTGALINLNPTTNRAIRILQGTPQGPSVLFNAYTGSWSMIIDANGKIAQVITPLNVNGDVKTAAVTLQPSPPELFRTEISFKNNIDWNNITIYRNMTLLPDSSFPYAFPGLEYGNVRNLYWQLDLNFGDGNGIFNDGDGGLLNFRNYLQTVGPYYTVTNGLFTVNGKAYISNKTSYGFNVNYVGPNSNMTVQTWANYNLTDMTKPIAANASTYYVNVTTTADQSAQNAPVDQNNSYLVNIPKKYEMTTRTTTGNVTTRFHTNVTVDPGVDALVPNPRVNMIVEKSINGTARAQVEGPVGKVYVKDADQNHYKAWVANATKVIFTANATTDRENRNVNVKDANFTWEFKWQNQTTNATKWGIWTWNNFSNNPGWYTVHLTVEQANPTNVTQRWINVTVDNVAPTAVIKTNRTTMDNPPSFPVNETVFTTFIATNSTDVLYNGATETGLVREWSWDFDGDGKVDRLGSSVSWNYSKPGNFNTTLFVTDQVGHKSANRTMPVTVRDISPPKVAITILDKSNSWKETSALVEKKQYYFNASETSDNSLKHAWDNVNLTYKFHWGDGQTNVSTGSTNATALNMTHTWTKFGSNYKVNISATDASGNVGWLNQTMVIQANTTAHPDLNIISNSLVITPNNPEEGGTVQFSVNFTNAKGKATATDLKLNLTMSVSGKDQEQSVANVQWVDSGGNAVTSLAAGVNATLKFTWIAPSVGNKSLKIKVWDGNEPDAWITVANEQTTSIAVKEAGWKFWAIVGGFVFVVIGLPIIYYVVRKVRAGEWTLRRKRTDEDEEEEEEEEEGDEDEGDTSGKKRL